MRQNIKILLSALIVSSGAHAEDPNSIGTVPFEKLGELEVTSVSKQPENSFQSAAAIFVLTGEEIKRSGATSVPEALRFVPGVEVARIDSNRWAITARGFNREFANKLLVMVDGRTVYNPLFAGTYWDAQDLLIEDIDRIEIIRGPGASLWGSNAVNGVISIYTKDSKYTQGNYGAVSAGSYDKNITELRHGGELETNAFYRMSAKYSSTHSSEFKSGADAGDDSKRATTNWRMDWATDPHNNYTVLFNATDGTNGREYLTPVVNTPIAISEDHKGLNSLIRWENNHEDSNSQLQFYVDYTTRDDPVLVDQKNLTLDLDWQHSSNVTDRFNFMWGAGYRYFTEDLTAHQTDGVTLLNYNPNQSHNSLYSSFVQGKYSLIPQRLNLTVGSKFEQNYYTGFEYQPSIRMSWTPTSTQTVWTAVSRAVRIPSIGERSISLVFLKTAPNTYLTALGQDSVQAENLTAYEIGYRIEPYRWLMLDIAAYDNVYESLRSFEFNGTAIPIANNMDGDVKGIEVSTRAQVTPDFMIQAGYTLLNMNLHADAGSTDFLSPKDVGNSPRNVLNFLTRYNVRENLYLDANFSTRSSLPTRSISEQSRLDLTATWRPIDNIQVSLVGQNLTDHSHQEFLGGTYGIPTEIPRSILGKVSVNF